MWAAVTEGVGTMAVLDRPPPPAPGRSEVLLAPEAVGICGSDYHFFAGELSDAAGGSQFPRVLGHEVAAKIAAVGADCRAELAPGQRVALWPLRACGDCYPCSLQRPGACENFELTGIHVDGGMQERLTVAEDQVFPIAVDSPAVASLAEPMSIAVRAVTRGRIVASERVVVLGAGPIGQCVCVAARARGAEVLMVDLQQRRLDVSRELGACETLLWTTLDEVVHRARSWAGPSGPPVAVDATGVPLAVRAMVELLCTAGRAVQVGMSNHEVALRIGSFTEKELDLLGVSCCGEAEFAEAVAIVERHASLLARLISHEFPLAQAPEALRFAIENPNEVMKVVIRGVGV
ncbi:MAG: alcohol dehydrogenase catalytic domain-containing protein [Solirubrobacterales bacterium]|nr:alcohol dehydrogenase catalytic domain-containing protein [Solirubrobacterales bacterium]